MNARTMIVPMALAASLGLGACGGDDNKDSSDLSRGDLATKADAAAQRP